MSNRALNAAWASDVRGAARMVLLVLADFANDSGIAWPGYEAIAQKANKAPERCMKLVKDLVKAGAITVEWGAGPCGVNVYHLDPIMAPAGVGGGDDLDSKVNQKCSKSESEMVPESSPNPSGTPGTPIDSQFPSVTESAAPARKRQAKPKPDFKPLTADQRAKILADYGGTWPPDETNQRIDLALSHTAAGRYTDMNLYVRGWLNRDRERSTNVRTFPAPGNRQPPHDAGGASRRPPATSGHDPGGAIRTVDPAAHRGF